MLIAVAVVVLGLLGWAIWLNFFNHTEPATISTPTESAGNEDKPTEETPPIPMNYLTITEWGVKLPIDGAISDAKYYMLGDEVLLTTARIEAACVGQERCSVGTLTRSKQEPTTDDDDDSDESSGTLEDIKLGDYYYSLNLDNEEGWRYQFAEGNEAASRHAAAALDAYADSFEEMVKQ